jgi:perosamine synthetase
MIQCQLNNTKDSNLPEVILSILKSILPKDRDIISLHEPHFSGNEWNYVKNCLDSNFVSSVGEYVDKFEDMLVDYTGVKKAIAVVNGTAALHIALKLTGVQINDEVLLPTLTFIATANAVSYLNAMPHFVDSDYKTLGIDPQKLYDYLKEIGDIRKDGCYNKKTGRRIRAVVPVHTFGHPVDLDSLHELCKRYGIELVEDAAEAVGSFYKKRHVGNWGKFSILSFNGNKTITTGGGGAILTNDKNLGRLAKHITTTAKKNHQWEFNHDQIGYNYRMPNINAALGCAQLEQLSTLLEQKRCLAKKYAEMFMRVKGVRFFAEPEFALSNYWLNVLLLENSYRHERDRVLETTNSRGIMTRPVWTLMHKLPMYKKCPRMDLSVAEKIEKILINIPSSAQNCVTVERD